MRRSNRSLLLGATSLLLGLVPMGCFGRSPAAPSRSPAPDGGSPGDADGGSPGDGDAPPCTPVTLHLGENSTDDENGVTADTYIRNDLPDQNYGSTNPLVADLDVPELVALIRFDLDPVPSGVELLSARLWFSMRSVGDGYDPSTDTYELHAIEEPWGELEATWNQRSTGLLWTTAGCGAPGSRAAETLGSTSLDFAADERFAVELLPTAVAELLDGSRANHGWAWTSTGDDGATVLSSDGPTDGARPSLELTYCP